MTTTWLPTLARHIFLRFGLPLLMTILSLQAKAQSYGDPRIYLIDSLNLKSLSYQDSLLIDTSIVLYHKSKSDTERFEILEHIVDECWNSRVWPQYNDYLFEKIQERLKGNSSPKERKRFIYFLAGSISNKGFLYDQKGNILSALNYYHKSLELYELIGNENGTSTLFNNLGVIYSTIGDTTKALEYHNKSLETKRKLGDMRGVAMSYVNIGAVYENSGLPFVALEYYESSLEISERIQDKRGLAISYDNIGDLYLSENIVGKAYEFYDKGYKTWSALEDEVGITTSLDNLSNALLKLERYDEAREMALKSFEIAENLGFAVDIENSSITLSNIYRQEKDYKKALEYYERSITIQEETQSKENERLALKKSMQYAYEKESLKDSLRIEKERELYNIRMAEKETQAYALYGGIVLLMLILSIAIYSFIQKQKDNKKINEQKHEVESQKVEIEKQHAILATTHREISDSISYAKRIQDAILPTTETFNHYLKSGFVFFQPKDVVSGDFYWIHEDGDRVIFAVADCTGHGVPGALVSVVCHNALNRVVREFNINEPAQILGKTREIIIEAFTGNNEQVKDGMDISLCSWNTKTNEMKWAGANNPLYVIRDNSPGEIDIINPDKQPVGNFELAGDFTQHKLQLQAGDCCYLFSDGYMDQFGGEKGKKYKYSRFRKFLLSICSLPMNDQQKKLKEEFLNWKGKFEQLDDVCVVGIRILEN